MNTFLPLVRHGEPNDHHRSWLHAFAFALTLGVMVVGFLAVTVVVRRTSMAVATGTASFTAAHLAGESLELVRAVRDSNWRLGRAWDTDLDDGDYLIAYTLTTPSRQMLCRLGSQDCPTVRPLDQNEATGFYGYDGWGFTGRPSTFTRSVSLHHAVDTSLNPYLLVTAQVSWGTRQRERLTAALHLYNWRTP